MPITQDRFANIVEIANTYQQTIRQALTDLADLAQNPEFPGALCAEAQAIIDRHMPRVGSAEILARETTHIKLTTNRNKRIKLLRQRQRAGDPVPPPHQMTRKLMTEADLEAQSQGLEPKPHLQSPKTESVFIGTLEGNPVKIINTNPDPVDDIEGGLFTPRS